MGKYTMGKPWKVAKEQHIMDVAYRMFSDRGIEAVPMPAVAEACGVGNATLYRYFPAKLDLVVSIGTWKWNEYIALHDSTVTGEEWERMTGADQLRFFMDAFMDLYRNHRDILRYNYSFNNYLRYEKASLEQTQSYMGMVDALVERFHRIYERGQADGTLNTEISEDSMFSSLFHIMLAAVTRYAVGLVYLPKEGADPESELVMLENLLLKH